MASQIKELCLPQGGDSEEEQLKNFLGKISCLAEVWDADEEKDRIVAGVHTGRTIATLKLCCVYGCYAGAGAGLSATELEALKEKVPSLFSEEPARRRPAVAQAHPVEPEAPEEVHGSGSEAETESDLRESSDPEPDPALLVPHAPAAGELKSRGDRAFEMLEPISALGIIF